MPDVFWPDAPRPPHFDPERQAWVLSRYADVAAALRTTSLQQALASNQITTSNPAEHHSEVLSAVQNDLARLNTPAWRSTLETTLQSQLNRHRGSSVDLVSDILQPWSVTILLELAGLPPSQSKEISRIATRMFYATAAATPNPSRSLTARIQRKFAHLKKERDTATIQRLSNAGMVHLSTLAGITQTLPSFLAKAWLALLQSPEQAIRLAAIPDVAPAATEELLRYAGTVHTLYRRAAMTLNIGDATILEGQQVLLRIASANFDPDRFDNPTELDILRKPLANLGLGTGMHACVGAVIVRLVSNVATPVFLSANPAPDLHKQVRWTVDSSLRWPSVVPIRLNSNS